MVLKALEQLDKFGVKRVIFNTHHAAKVFARCFPEKRWKGLQLIFRHESQLLDTAGAVGNIRDLWPEGEDLIVWNGDVEASLNLEAAFHDHLEHPESVSTLLLLPDSSGNVLLHPEGHIEDFRSMLQPQAPPGHCYSGICFLRRTILQKIPLQEPISLVDTWIELIRERPGSLRGIVPRSLAWREIGTVAALLKVRAERLSPGGGVRVAEEVLKNETAQVLQATPGAIGFSPLPGGGSTRSYLRVLVGDVPAGVVLCQFDPAFPENHRFCSIAREWSDNGLPVPEIIAERQCLYWMTDLGDESLESWVKGNDPDSQSYQPLFDEIGRSLRKLHGHQPENPPILQEPFGVKLFSWEHDYFFEHCAEQVFGISREGELARSAKAELNLIAERLDSLPKVLIHRDFQSRNIVIHGQKPTWIDFQGARFGPAAYDLGSFLYDPYIEMDDRHRRAFLDGYGREGAEDGAVLPLAGIQRLTQALGAYGNLSLNRGKPEFFPYLGTALDRLAQLLGEKGLRREFPTLKRLISTLREDWHARQMRSNRVENPAFPFEVGGDGKAKIQ